MGRRIELDLAIALINGYQRYLSPYKGYSCAYRVRNGGDSCSEFAKKVLGDEGLRVGVERIRARFRACHAASRSIKARQLSNWVHDEYTDEPTGDGMKSALGAKTTRSLREALGESVAECCCQGGFEHYCEPAATHYCEPAATEFCAWPF